MVGDLSQCWLLSLVTPWVMTARAVGKQTGEIPERRTGHQRLPGFSHIVPPPHERRVEQ